MMYCASRPSRENTRLGSAGRIFFVGWIVIWRVEGLGALLAFFWNLVFLFGFGVWDEYVDVRIFWGFLFVFLILCFKSVVLSSTGGESSSVDSPLSSRPRCPSFISQPRNFHLRSFR